MNPLNDDTRAWLDEAVREEAMPSEDRARLWKAISATVAPAPAPGVLDRAVPLRHVLGIAALGLGAGVAIGHATSLSPAPIATPTVIAPSSPPVVSVPAPSAVTTSSASPEPSASVPIAAVPSAARSAARPDGAMDEVRTILRAKRALADGHPKDALTALEEHERTYPHGSLAEERDALRVLALCADGRATEGAAERAAFLRAHPLSAYGDRVRGACAP